MRLVRKSFGHLDRTIALCTRIQRAKPAAVPAMAASPRASSCRPASGMTSSLLYTDGWYDDSKCRRCVSLQWCEGPNRPHDSPRVQKGQAGLGVKPDGRSCRRGGGGVSRLDGSCFGCQGRWGGPSGGPGQAPGKGRRRAGRPKAGLAGHKSNAPGMEARIALPQKYARMQTHAHTHATPNRWHALSSGSPCPTALQQGTLASQPHTLAQRTARRSLDHQGPPQ